MTTTKELKARKAAIAAEQAAEQVPEALVPRDVPEEKTPLQISNDIARLLPPLE